MDDLPGEEPTAVLDTVDVHPDFRGKGVINSIIDLPFALPTAVSGIALTAVYARTGWIGRHLEPLGMLNIYLGYVAGRGTGIAPAFVAVG